MWVFSLESIISYFDRELPRFLGFNNKPQPPLDFNWCPIQNITKDKKNLINNMMSANKNNVVFVNFHEEKRKEAFGKKDLFKKINDFFIASKFFQEVSENLNPEEVEKKAEILKKRAQSVLTLNKVGGSLIGLLPGIDWLVQKYVIKKNITKKIGGIFGISVNFINEQE